jgi:hypothetical protein
VQWDTEFEYHITSNAGFAVGARNVTNAYPAVNMINATNGAIFADGPVDWQGGFYYGRLTIGF